MDDIDLLERLGAVLDPGFLERVEGGFRLCVESAEPGEDLRKVTATGLQRFDVLVGAARVFTSSGVLRVKETRYVAGAVRDGMGNQYLRIEPAIEIRALAGKMPEDFAQHIRDAISQTPGITSALRSLGASRAGPVHYYHVFELAHDTLGGADGIREHLDLSRKLQGRFTNAANNTAPEEGGRHASVNREPPMTLDEQNSFARSLLNRWLHHAAASAFGSPIKTQSR